MSIAMRRAKSKLGAAAVAAVAAAGLAPVAHATLTVNLSLGNGTTSMSLTSAQANTDIPIYVYATVTGSSAPTAPAAGGTSSMNAPTGTTGEYDGLQYLYYNITNSGATPIAGGIDTTTAGAPVLNATLGFNGTGLQPNPTPTAGFPAGFFGAQTGTIQNVAGGTSLGSANASTATTTSITDVAKPRANSAVFQNAATYNQNNGTFTTVGASTGAMNGANIVINGNAVSFLVETLNFKPTSTTTGSTTFAVSIPTLPSPYFGANWFQDNTTTTSGAQPMNTMNGTYSAGTSVVFNTSSATGPTTKQIMYGDINGDGKVDGTDFATLTSHFGQVVPAYTDGDLNGDGKVDGTDFATLTGHFGTASPSSIIADDAAEIDSFAVAHDLPIPVIGSAVPEPASLALFAIGGLTVLTRRKR